MSELSRFNEKDIVAAMLVVGEIMDLEEFELQTRVASYRDAELQYDDSLEGQTVFAINDLQGGDWSKINCDVMLNLGHVMERLEFPHNDYFYAAYDNRKAVGEDIPRDDWDRKVLVFLESEFCQDLLMSIDVQTYLKYEEKYFSDVKGAPTYIDFLGELNPGEREKYVRDDVNFDAVGYLCDKAIALKIMDTQSAYPMVEYGNSIYVAAHGDWYDSPQDILKDLSAGENSFCNNYSNYGTLVETELYQVKDDMNDLGLVNEFDVWEFYLSEYELEYIGLGDEKDKIKDDNKEVEFDEVLANASVRSEALDTNRENVVEHVKE